MLVPSPKVGDEIITSGHIGVRITARNGDRARVGVSAPP
jgi:sRNA-binding carbon storage regulator CsrA